jgi:AcrR family transcriptional regulator
MVSITRDLKKSLPKKFVEPARLAGARIAHDEELGVSHTTLFNRFGSKEGLMLAALGPPTRKVSWVAALEQGPDERPIRDQLVEHAKLMSAFYEDLQAGFGILQAAGIDIAKAHKKPKGDTTPSAPEEAYGALVAWFERAQQQLRCPHARVNVPWRPPRVGVHRACLRPTVKQPWITSTASSSCFGTASASSDSGLIE